MKKIITAILILLTLSMFVYAFAPEKEPSPASWQKRMICEGDTLWNIALEVKDADNISIDTRTIISLIIEKNNLNNEGYIHTGEVLLIPEYIPEPGM